MVHAIDHAEIVPKTSRLCQEALTISQLVHLGNVYGNYYLWRLILLLLFLFCVVSSKK